MWNFMISSKPPESGVEDAVGRESNAAEWMRERLKFEPDEVQRRVLSGTGKRVVLNCTRQWGKSTITAAKAVHQASTEPGCLTVVVSPSARQSGEFVRKAAEVGRRLGSRRKATGT